MSHRVVHVALWWFVAFSQLAGWQPPQVYETKKECETSRAVFASKLFPGDLISECQRVEFEVVGQE